MCILTSCKANADAAVKRFSQKRNTISEGLSSPSMEDNTAAFEGDTLCIMNYFASSSRSGLFIVVVICVSI